MKILRTILLTLFFVAPAVAQERPFPPASQEEVNAGLIHNKFVAPDTLANYSGVSTNAAAFAVTNNVTLRDRQDLNGVYASLAPVWTNFVDGILFQPRFGTNTSLKLKAVTGTRNTYSQDQWGLNMASGLSLPLSSSLSNVTVVVMLRDVPPWKTGGATVWSIANTTNKSEILAASTTPGIYLFQETYRYQQWAGANNGSYSNLFLPLRVISPPQYQYDEMLSEQGQPMVIAWQRDVNGNWRMYLDTMQGKMNLNNPAFVQSAVTNATDPLNFFTMGYSAITNPGTWGSYSRTNITIASAFIFNTTNQSAVVAGYKAALWALDTDSAEFWYGDSRECPQTGYVREPGYFYQRRISPLTWFKNYAQGGSRARGFNDDYIPAGGVNSVSNLPSGKFKNVITTWGYGINDIYQDGILPDQLFDKFTNSIGYFIRAGSRVRFLSVYQVGTNALIPASQFTYSLAKETNAFRFNELVRTNFDVPTVDFVPLRDIITQSMIQTNGPFSFDGIHIDGRTNPVLNQMVGDFIYDHGEANVTNTAIGPLGRVAGESTASGGGGATWTWGQQSFSVSSSANAYLTPSYSRTTLAQAIAPMGNATRTLTNFAVTLNTATGGATGGGTNTVWSLYTNNVSAGVLCTLSGGAIWTNSGMISIPWPGGTNIYCIGVSNTSATQPITSFIANLVMEFQ